MRSSMHSDDINIDIFVVSTIIKESFPKWGTLPISPLGEGTSNYLFRLGNDMVIRIPRHRQSVETLEKERQWLPFLSSNLNWKIPRPIADGKVGEHYPFPWYIYNWIDGKIIEKDVYVDQDKLVIDMTNFLKDLQKLDTKDAPLPGAHNFYRGVELKSRDSSVRNAINSLSLKLDLSEIEKIWNRGLRAKRWDKRGLWIHGDLDSRNLLVNKDGGLAGIIDFGGLAVGDPAVDAMVAFKLFDKEHREIFRERLKIDDDMWARGKGWVVSQALIALDYYTLENNPVLVLLAYQWLEAVKES